MSPRLHEPTPGRSPGGFVGFFARRSRRVLAVAGLALMLGAPSAVGQGEAHEDTASSGTDTAAKEAKKGGLLGRVKKLARDRTVQRVAEAVACTAIPGGAAVVAAAEAARERDPAEVAGLADPTCPLGYGPGGSAAVPTPDAMPGWFTAPPDGAGEPQAQQAALRRALEDGRAQGLDSATLRQMEEMLGQLEASGGTGAAPPAERTAPQGGHR